MFSRPLTPIKLNTLKLRVAVLYTDFAHLAHWEMRLLAGVLDAQALELMPITVPKKALDQKDHLLLRLQERLEQRFFKIGASIAVECLEKRLSLQKPLQLGMAPAANGLAFTEGELEVLAKQRLDVIINLTTWPPNEQLAQLATHGVWQLFCSDAYPLVEGPIGFWEVLHKKEVIGAVLGNLLPGNQGFAILDRAHFNRAWSMTETKHTVQEGSVSLVLKHLLLLARGCMPPQPQDWIVTYPKPPGISEVLHYQYGFFAKVLDKLWDKLGNAYLGIRPERWSLFLGTGKFLEAKGDGLKPLEMPKDEFWADPFLLHHGGGDYLFFENYSYSTKRGKISCGRIQGTALVDVVDVMKREHHLSFPFVFKEGDDIFLLPETSENMRLELYRAKHFPTEWELYATAFEGEAVADAHIHKDDHGDLWLFLNKQASHTAPMNSELYIYQMDSLKMENLRPHAQNPVLIDARVARNGGAIFKEKGIWYRPSQRNVDGVYGRALNLNRIDTLNLQTYRETTVDVVWPMAEKGLNALHHVHQVAANFVFDAAYKRKKTSSFF